jgi:hypothetical protein
MSNLFKKTIGISDLIARLKTELLSKQNTDEPNLFSIDEITVEVNFVIDGNIESGFNLGVVTLGSEVSEERVQKITVKMSPIVSKQQLIEKINRQPEEASKVLEASSRAVLRGKDIHRE